MKCIECSENDVISINKPGKVEFRCRKGHTWYEDYIDNGGIHQRPESYEIKFEDTLFKDEKLLYNKILREISKNHGFFLASTAEEITSFLIDKCKFNKIEVSRLFKKLIGFKQNPGI